MKINYQECGGWFWPETSTLKPIDANFTWKNFKNEIFDLQRQSE